MKIDNIDGKIMQLLRENSRMKNVEIAQCVSLTEGAVRARIDRLVKGGGIQRFTIESSAEAGGVFGIVMLKTKGDIKKAMQEVSSLGLHHYAFEISGDYDGCLVLEAPSLTELDKKIDQIRSCRGIQQTITFIAVKKWEAAVKVRGKVV